MNKEVKFVLIGALALFSCSSDRSSAIDLPEWLESDSVLAIQQRINSDFSLTLDQAKAQLHELYPEITDNDIDKYIQDKKLEVRLINDKYMMHRKSPRNLKLLAKEVGGDWYGRGSDATDEEMSWVDTIVSSTTGTGDLTNSLKIRFRFSIDVPKHEFLIGDTLRVWMPLPIESERQHDVKIVSSSHEYIVSTGKSVHNTLYFEQPVKIESDSILHFDYVGEYMVSAQHFMPAFIENNIIDYNTKSDIYKKYTVVELPHIVRMDSLAKSIVGKENNPYKQSELVYDYIVSKYPWAGAREYSTIECIPQYVVDENHGDCGQVSLLYISIMRTLGIPARWESGWMLHPGQKNLHDWAEVYFEGVGWVPVDVSFGRYSRAKDRRVQNFYSTGMDQYRFASNKGVCGELFPRKKFLRSETVDFQVGEVECSKGNLFYPGWKKKLEVLSIEK